MEEVRLYSYWRSSCSWRVRLALAIKGIPHEIHPVNLLSQEHLTDGYLQVNPSGSLPTLSFKLRHRRHDDDGDKAAQYDVGQSMAIIELLEELYPPSINCKPILPKDPIGRALARQLALIIVGDTQPLQNMSLLNHLTAQLSKDDQKDDIKREWCQRVIRKGLAAFNHLYTLYLENNNNARPEGLPEIGLPEICLTPQIYNAERWGVNVKEEFQVLWDVYEHVNAVYPQAHPDTQPDRPLFQP